MKKPTNIHEQFVSRKLLALGQSVVPAPNELANFDVIEAGAVAFLRARLEHLLTALPKHSQGKAEFSVVFGIVLLFALQIRECLISEGTAVDSGFALRAFRASAEPPPVEVDSFPFDLIASDAESFANALVSASAGAGGAKTLLREIKATCLAALNYQDTEAAQLAAVESAISTICQSILLLGRQKPNSSVH